jgi:hypothetical protein
MVRSRNNSTNHTATSTNAFAVALCVSSFLMSTPALASASAPPSPSVAALATRAAGASAAAALTTTAEAAARASALRAGIATQSAQDAKSQAMSLTAAAVVAVNETRAIARSNVNAAVKVAAKLKSIEAARTAKGAQSAAQSAERTAAAQELAAVRATRSASSMRLAANAQAAIVTRMTSKVTRTSASVVVQSGSTSAAPTTIPAQNTSAPSVVVTTGSVLPPAVASFPIIYDSAPSPGFVSPIDSAQKYLIVYQSDFSSAFDPTTQTEVEINVNAVIEAIGRKVPASGVPQWGVLDIENPFDEILKTGPSDVRFEPAVASLVNVIRAVRVAYPHIKWTYYGFPRVPYWLGMKDWGGLAPEVREANYVQFARNYEQVMAEMEWFMPSLYDVYERARAMPNCESPREIAEAEYRKACVCVISRWFDRARIASRPIIPVVSPWFQPGGIATAYQAIPMDEFCAEQVRPGIEAGANGMAVWGEMGFFLKVATAPHFPSAQYVQEWQLQTRAAFSPLVQAPTSGALIIDWTSPSTISSIGASLNQTLVDAMRAIEARGEAPQ